MEKPFDIRERAFLFSCSAVSAFPQGRLGHPAARVWSQFLAAATSGGAHLEEAEAASSRAHFVSLNRGALRELREARYWARLVIAAKLAGHERMPELEAEASQLVAIVTTIVRNASAKLSSNKPRRSA
jgi:four helix bundle protein